MWIVGNYHWYLKQEFVLNMDEQLTSKPVLEWDTIEPYLLHGYYPGEFTILPFKRVNIAPYDFYFTTVHFFSRFLLCDYKNITIIKTISVSVSL